MTRRFKSFTLIELMVVVAIIMILVTTTAGISFALTSSEKTRTIKLFESCLTRAKTLAERLGCTVALRIERGYRIDKRGSMVKSANGEAIWKNHQQIKLVVQGYKQTAGIRGYLGQNKSPFGFIPEQYGFQKVINSSTIELPKNWWLAPGFAKNNLDVVNFKWQPSNNNATPINPFETFYVVFNHKGELQKNASWLYYLDETQPYGNKIPAVEHPTGIARSVILYDRHQFNNAQVSTLNKGTEILISRQGQIIVAN